MSGMMKAILMLENGCVVESEKMYSCINSLSHHPSVKCEETRQLASSVEP